MATVINGTMALRAANHLHNRMVTHGADEEDVALLRDIRDWIRGMVALDLMAAQAEARDRPVAAD